MVEDAITQLSADRRERARRLSFFDGNIWLGRPEGFPLARELTVGELETTLRENLITGGLISHWRGKTLSAQAGNRALETDLASDVYGVWTGLPLFPVEDGPLPGEGEIPTSVRGVRLFPKSHNFPLVDWTIGSLCRWLTERHMPLFIWHTELDWPALHEIAQSFRDLTIIVESQPQKILYHTRPLFALMRECENILVELSNFAGQGLVEYAVSRFGPERLIFGSFLPVNDPAVGMGLVLDADIPEEAKRLIAGGNLRRLISEVRV